MTSREWRVCYRRAAWQRKIAPKVKVFQSRTALERFLARLEDHESRRLSPATFTVQSRKVGRWASEEPCKP